MKHLKTNLIILLQDSDTKSNLVILLNELFMKFLTELFSKQEIVDKSI